MIAERGVVVEERVAPARRAAAFLDRDGVINVNHGYVSKPEDLEFTPTAVEAIRWLNENDYLVIVVTNQSGVARGYYGVEDVVAFHDHLQAELQRQCARIDHFYYCPYHPDGSVPEFACQHEDRKPAPGMLLKAMADLSIDRSRSFMIGDNESDRMAGERAGVRAMVIPSDTGDLVAAVLQMTAAARAPVAVAS